MTGANGQQQLPALQDLTRRAASFLRMARLALTGAATPAQLLAEQDVVSGGGCSPRYKSISTEDDTETDGDTRWRTSSDPKVEADESEELLMAGEGEDPRMRFVSEHSVNYGAHVMNKMHELRHRRPASGAAYCRSEKVAVVESEPLILRQHRGEKRANDVVDMVHHPFGCDRQAGESSALLLLSS